MWLNNLKELKKASGMTVKQIAEKANMSERTVTRVFSGDTDAPRMDTLRDIVYALGGSMDDLLAETDFKLPTPEIDILRKELASLQTMIEEMSKYESSLKDEITNQKHIISKLTSENELLKLRLDHKEELLALQKEMLAQHHYYTTH